MLPRFLLRMFLANVSCPSISCQTGAERFQQCTQFALLRNRGLGVLAVTVLPIPFARRATATACAAAIDSAPFSSLVIGALGMALLSLLSAHADLASIAVVRILSPVCDAY
jgi:hypothetical protein